MTSNDKNEYVLPNQEAIKKLLISEYDSSTAIIIRLAWQAGLTAAEIVGLRWDDIDLERGVLSVSGRAVPLCDDFLAFLNSLDQKGAYVVFSPKSKDGAMSRISASRKVRTALDLVGETKVRLWDLRFDYIIRLLNTDSLEEVARTTDCELLSLQKIYKRYVQHDEIPKRAKKLDVADNVRLKQAIEADCSTLDARIVMLSWICGLSLGELSHLKWKDMILSDCEISVKGIKYPVSKTISDALSAEKAVSNDSQYVLQGIRSGSRLPAEFLSRRAGEFFARHGLDHFTISSIQGKYNTPSDSILKERMMDLLSKSGGHTLNRIARALKLKNADADRLLQELIASGDVKAPLASQETNWDKFSEALESQLSANTIISPQSIVKLTGLGQNLIDYYLKKAISAGMIEKTGHGQYRRPKK